MRKVITLACLLGLFGQVDAQFVYEELNATYPNGLSTATHADAIDTLVGNTAETVKIAFGRSNVQKNAYPEFVTFLLENVTDINNGERIVVVDAMGFKDVTLDTSVAVGDTITSAATAGLSGSRTINTGSASGAPGTHVLLGIRQLSSAAATDSISYRLRVFGVYRKNNR